MITINVTGVDAVLMKLNGLSERLKNIDISAEGQIFENEYMRRIFKDGRKTDGTRITYASGKFVNKKGKILYDTGFLFNHINIEGPKNNFSIAINDDETKISNIEKRFGKIFGPQISEVKRLKELIQRKVLKSI